MKHTDKSAAVSGRSRELAQRVRRLHAAIGVARLRFREASGKGLRIRAKRSIGERSFVRWSWSGTRSELEVSCGITQESRFRGGDWFRVERQLLVERGDPAYLQQTVVCTYGAFLLLGIKSSTWRRSEKLG